MQNILREIVKNKKKEIDIKPKDSFDFCRGRSRPTLVPTFIQNITRENYDISLIAEIKLKSPSSGVLASSRSVLKKALEYEESGADCISIITDKKYFGGDITLIQKVRKKVNLPILQKDFVIDPHQIYESKMIGSNAILLIAKILPENKLKEFVDLTFKVGLEPVVEVYDEEDLRKALKTKAKIIGVNARNLQNMEINVEKAAKLLSKIPKTKIRIGFSGVKTRQDVAVYKKAGAQAVLVGTALMKAKDVKSFISCLKSENKS